MYTVKEVSRISGVSVRTLHHYDRIGLLKPASVTAAGYRLYDEASLARLQTILFYRELRFPLRDICAMLDDPSFDRTEALRQQLHMLRLQRTRLDALIGLAEHTLKTGGSEMDFSAFDNKELQQYAAEAKSRWGKTAAWQEYEARGDAANGTEALYACFADFGALRGRAPSDVEVQKQVEALQACITANFYTCTPQILAGLGQMYAADPRFRENIDRAGGTGTAEFAAAAIAHYCKAHR